MQRSRQGEVKQDGGQEGGQDGEQEGGQEGGRRDDVSVNQILGCIVNFAKIIYASFRPATQNVDCVPCTLKNSFR